MGISILTVSAAALPSFRPWFQGFSHRGEHKSPRSPGLLIKLIRGDAGCLENMVQQAGFSPGLY